MVSIRCKLLIALGSPPPRSEIWSGGWRQKLPAERRDPCFKLPSAAISDDRLAARTDPVQLRLPLRAGSHATQATCRCTRRRICGRQSEPDQTSRSRPLVANGRPPVDSRRQVAAHSTGCSQVPPPLRGPDPAAMAAALPHCRRPTWRNLIGSEAD